MLSETEQLQSPITPARAAAQQAAQQFAGHDIVQTLHPLGSGNINDTYLVNLVDTEQPFVLQRINTSVFPNPHQVMDNLCQFVHHAGQRLDRMPPNRRWEVPTVLRTRHNQHHWTDRQGNVWRGLSFVRGTTTFDTIQNQTHAVEIGYGLGCFHNLLSDLPTNRLTDTLPGFHITPNYLHQYDAVLAKATALSLEERHCCRLIANHRAQLSVLEDAKA